MSTTDEPTLPHPVVRWDVGLETDTAGEPAGPALPAADTLGGDGLVPADDAQWDWPSRAAKPGVRVRIPVLALVALLFAAGGLWGGAALQRSHGISSTGSSAASNFASLFGRRGTTGSGTGTATRTGSGLFGGSAPAATGTVTAVEGDVVYLTTSSGSIEKVIVAKTTTVTRDTKSSAAALQPGDTAIVEGTKETDGNIDATSIAATQAGVTSAFAGLGG